MISLLKIMIGLSISGSMYTPLAFGQTPLDKLQSHFKKKSSLSGNFAQDRFIKSIETHLVSKGTFKVTKDNGLNWNQDHPFASTFHIENGKASLQVQDRPSQKVDLDQQPQIQIVSQIFRSLLLGDASKIESYFDRKNISTGSPWVIELYPKNKNLKSILSKVRIRGNLHIDRLDILETGGGSTKITFRQVQAQ